jgi:hypothetical protein
VALEHRILRLGLALALASSACRSSEPPAARSPAVATAPATGYRAPTTPPALPPQPGAELIARACHTEHADPSSVVYVALDTAGRPARLVVTPSRTIADMGNLIVDLDGELLGTDTGGEFPWDDADAVARERARVATLMNGAEVPRDTTPIPCAS